MFAEALRFPAREKRRTTLESFRSHRPLFFGSALLAGLAVGACTTAQETAFFNTWSAICTGLPQGAELAVSIASNVPGLQTISAGVVAGAEVASGVCSTVEQSVANVVNQINSLNGTATITVTQTGGNAAAADWQVRNAAARYGARVRTTYGHRVGGRFGAAPTVSWSFTVPPA